LNGITPFVFYCRSLTHTLLQVILVWHCAVLGYFNLKRSVALLQHHGGLVYRTVIQLYRLFGQNKKSRHMDSKTSGRTFHPLALFQLKHVTALKFKDPINISVFSGRAHGLWNCNKTITTNPDCTMILRHCPQLLLATQKNNSVCIKFYVDKNPRMPLYRTFVRLSSVFLKKYKNFAICNF